MAEGKRKATSPPKRTISPGKKQCNGCRYMRLTKCESDEEVTFPIMNKQTTPTSEPVGVRPEDMAMINYLTNHISLANGTLKSELNTEFKTNLEPINRKITEN